MHCESLVAAARATQTVVANLALRPVPADTCATIITAVVSHIADVIDGCIPPVVERAHLIKYLVLAIVVAFHANIEVLREQFLTAIAVHVALGDFSAAAFAAHIAMAPRVNLGAFRCLLGVGSEGDGYLPLFVAISLHFLSLLTGPLVPVDNEGKGGQKSTQYLQRR